MRVPLSWLKEYVALDCGPAEIAKMLTMAGLEVEAIETIIPDIQGVVAARVSSVEPHPNADKLVIASIDDGTTTHTVVCGDPKCRSGMIAAFAPVGARLKDPDGSHFTIEKAKLRGVESHGMLCSGKELRVNDDDSGIMHLSGDIPLGTSIADLFQEVVFEIALTPNLGHCSSIMGVVRELSAITGNGFTYPSAQPKENPNLSIHDEVSVTVTCKEVCPRYTCRLIKGVQVGPSPVWLQRKLELLGMRSINNVVDIANFIMMEIGQPMHAFDLDTLRGNAIFIKMAREGEVFTTLDEKHRTLGNEIVMIADGSTYLAIGGVMGGLESEVKGNTVNILLESAHFDARNIRRTSKKLGIQTDSSKRFERGIDPQNIIPALDRAAYLIQTLAGGDVARGVIDVLQKERSPLIIDCRISRVNHVLGSNLSEGEIEAVFKRLQFPTKLRDSDTLQVEVPTYRNDITTEIDLIEEVARLIGYENFRMPAVHFEGSRLPHAPIFLFERNIRSHLVAEGLQEMITCDLISPDLVSLVEKDVLGDKSIVKVLNPTSVEQSLLRPSLLPGLLMAVKHNSDRQEHTINAFELGRIHFKDQAQYREQSVVGIILTGAERPIQWDRKPQEVDFYAIKGIVENILKALGIDTPTFKEGTIEAFHPGRQALVYVDELVVGSLGEVHPALTRRFSLTSRIYYAEINLHDLIQKSVVRQQMKPLAQYPCSVRDWTITLKQGASVQEVIKVIRSMKSPILESVSLIDLYQSERLGKDKKNVTFRLVYRDTEKTLSQEQVDGEHFGITQETLKKIGKVVI